MVDKPKNYPKKSKYRAVLIALAIILMLGCMWTLYTLNSYVDEVFASMVIKLDKDAVQEFIGVQFPDSAEDVYTIGLSALDTSVATRFDMPSDDLPAYLNELGISTEAVQGNSPFLSTSLLLFGEADWWQISQIETQDYAGLSEFVNFKQYKILIVNLDASRVRIYMTVHNT